MNGVSVEYLRADGTIGDDPVRVIDFDDPEQNDWLVVNQFTVIEGQAHAPARRGRLRQRPAARR